MAEIPEDVMKRARTTASLLLLDTVGELHATPIIARAIQEAVEAERERCATVALRFKSIADFAFKERVDRSVKGEDALELAAATAVGMSHQARAIANAILNPPASKGGDHE